MPDKNIFTPMGGRRFFISVMCCLLNTWLVREQTITGDVYMWIILGTVGAFITGNVGQKIWGNYGPTTPSNTTPQNDGRQY